MEWKSWSAETFGVCNTEQSLYYGLELQASGIRSVRGFRVGELGFGNGEFAAWVRSCGGNWVGREAITELNERARGAGFEVVEENRSFSTFAGANSFDLIVAFDVIEHLTTEAIRAFLMEAHDALRPDGFLIFRTPSGDSPFSGAMYNGDLTHRSLLGSSAASQLALDARFHILQIRSPVLPIRGLGLRRGLLRAIIHVAQAASFSFVRNALMGRRSAVISPNMMVVLRKDISDA